MSVVCPCSPGAGCWAGRGLWEPPLKDLAVLGQIMGWALPLVGLLGIPVKWDATLLPAVVIAYLCVQPGITSHLPRFLCRGGFVFRGAFWGWDALIAWMGPGLFCMVQEVSKNARPHDLCHGRRCVLGRSQGPRPLLPLHFSYLPPSFLPPSPPSVPPPSCPATDKDFSCFQLLLYKIHMC